MRICVLQSSYAESDHELRDIDTNMMDPSPFTDAHTITNHPISKHGAKDEIDAIVQSKKYDFYFNFFWGTDDDDVAGIDACRYFESLSLPSVGLRADILSKTKSSFYESARQRGRPRVPLPGTAGGFPVIVKPTQGYASMFMSETSVCHSEQALEKEKQKVMACIEDRRLRARQTDCAQIALGSSNDPSESVNGHGSLNGDTVAKGNATTKANLDQDLVVQEFVVGTDYLVSVIQFGNMGVALCPTIVKYPSDVVGNERFLTFDVKFHAETHLELIDENNDRELGELLRSVAVEAYEAQEMWAGCFGCDVDIRIRPNGEAVVLEVNPLPMAFQPDDSQYPDLPITKTFPGGYRALIDIAIANWDLRNKNHPEQNGVGKIYDGFATTYDDAFHISNLPSIVRTVIGKHNFDGSVLDLACGTGIIGEVLHETNDISSITGVDLSSGMIKVCQERGKYDSLSVDTMQDFVCTLKTSFDHVICFSSLYFLSPEMLSLVLSKSFLMARKSLTFSVDEVTDEYNATLTERGYDCMRGHNHLASIAAFGIPPGWKLVYREQFDGWKSPHTSSLIMVTCFHFERE